jgi:chromosome segregation protein
MISNQIFRLNVTGYHIHKTDCQTNHFSWRSIMVHVKRVELSHFKSFGGTTAVPILPGFTVVSGPNGSGKSNILDALLFCLGLASSKGMRAERLPDLVNHNNAQRSSREASVTVTFDLSEEGSEVPIDWSVTRRLRVSAQGSYTSNYYINGEPSTLGELHEKLSTLRVYPEGYNVVLQGDVTSIISMNARERREIIDELAGVAAFDRKINQAKSTLSEVKDKTDRCHIVVTELTAQRDRLSQDRIKAEKYQKLREELQMKTGEEAVLKWQSLQQQQTKLQQEILLGEETGTRLQAELVLLQTAIAQSVTELAALNQQVKAMGEEQLVAAQGTLANQQAEKRRLTQQQQEITASQQANQQSQQQNRQQLAQYQQDLQSIQAAMAQIEKKELTVLAGARDRVRNQLEITKEKASSLATSSAAWVQQQTQLTKQIEVLLESAGKQQTSQAGLSEREKQLAHRITEQEQILAALAPVLAEKQTQQPQIVVKLSGFLGKMAELESKLQAVEKSLKTQQETQHRLFQEQRDKERQLDKLEAQSQVQQEVQGTFATKVIREAKLVGVHGLIAQLGVVDSEYQLALSIAAGARMGNLVVTDDRVAAEAIEILKQKRAGRATFLPLNKISAPRLSGNPSLLSAQGFVDYAVNLVEFDERYAQIFSYVFGSTVVFRDLQQARNFLGKQRIVTLAGELLEASGAMTGGNINHKATLQFGTGESSESAEIAMIRQRLGEIETILQLGNDTINQDNIKLRTMSEQLNELKQQQRLTQLNAEQLTKDLDQISQQQNHAQHQLDQAKQEQTQTVQSLRSINQQLPNHEEELATLRQELSALEGNAVHEEWQAIQSGIRNQELELQQKERDLAAANSQLNEVQQQQLLCQEKIAESDRRYLEYQEQFDQMKIQLVTLAKELQAIATEISGTQKIMVELEQHLGAEKQKRDGAELSLRQLQQRQQEQQWAIEKLQAQQEQRRQALVELAAEIASQHRELPVGIEIPVLTGEINPEDLISLQTQIRLLKKRMEAMEPVNMLALEAYEEANARLEELNQKLATLAAESNELLLRIENFTTLRFQAFREAYDAVDANFQNIFAELSDGDGHLQLDDPQDPFNGGLNLVAHPKGKPIQRLSSMSGGEKSLTALSFIFALQRYRPSPFYAFDEVDMFLDGANVERLAKMIKKQAGQAQFIVVSLRRPMIEAADRTIGVTQARGAYTQVLGINLKSPA